ncbi:MAG: trimeric intracellular cation channel family protein [Sphingobacteriales bacterium]|nr:MAG: trimeric intracellular cation channel family protein [Sphingobacteriales bacterium]
MTIQYILELIGTVSFAISGAIAGSRKDHDLFGASFVGLITAIGGGTLRDVLLGSYPLVWIQDINILYAVLTGILIARIFYQQMMHLRRTLFLFDTMGIALFTIVGTEKALSLGVRPEIAALMGMFTAVMGGVIRDTLTNEIPVIFRKEIYASACLAGAVLYLLLSHFEIDRNLNFIASSALIIAIRMVAIRYDLSLPAFKRDGD